MEGSDCLDIRFSAADYYGGLHCGQPPDVNINGNRIPTRLEFNDAWYLVGVNVKDLIGFIVRIEY